MSDDRQDNRTSEPMVSAPGDLATLTAAWRTHAGYPDRYPNVRAAAIQLGFQVSGGGGGTGPAMFDSARFDEALWGGDPGAATPDLVLPVGILVERGDETAEGHLITGVTIAWWEIIRKLAKDPDFALHTIGGRAFEELIAGAYEREGWDVTLTPRSGDYGRDVIATRRGHGGSIRILDQAKAYKPGHKVTANDVRAMVGVLLASSNTTKAFISTTSRFAPRIHAEPNLASLIPFRLELRDGPQTREWLLANQPSP